MSKSLRSGHDLALFDDWAAYEFHRTGGFTALVVLVSIRDMTVIPLRSTFMHVVGDDIGWAGICDLLASAGVGWDGVVFHSLASESGGPMADVEARAALRALERRIVEDPLVINEGHFFDVWGRRMRIDEVQPQ